MLHGIIFNDGVFIAMDCCGNKLHGFLKQIKYCCSKFLRSMFSGRWYMITNFTAAVFCFLDGESNGVSKVVLVFAGSKGYSTCSLVFSVFIASPTFAVNSLF